MKIALIALAAVVPALALADDASPRTYVYHEGRAVSAPPSAPASAAPAAGPASTFGAFGTRAIHAAVIPRSSSGSADTGAPSAAGAESPRGFHAAARSSRRRGIVGSTPVPTPAPAPSGPPAFAVPGAKILSAGQQPVYSDPGNGGTHSVEGGGFIAIDQSRANDVGRSPGITWAPPDAPPSAGALSGKGGSGASSNGPAVGAGSAANAPATAANTNRGASGATGFDASF